MRTSWIDEERDIVVHEMTACALASPLRMLFGLAGQFGQHRFERAAEDVWHRGLVTPAQAEDYLDVPAVGTTGVRRMEPGSSRRDDRKRPSQSGLELDLVDVIGRRPPRAEAPAPAAPPVGRASIHLDTRVARHPTGGRARALVVARR